MPREIPQASNETQSFPKTRCFKVGAGNWANCTRFGTFITGFVTGGLTTTGGTTGGGGRGGWTTTGGVGLTGGNGTGGCIGYTTGGRVGDCGIPIEIGGES
ncbi:MAG: hypothetical protein EXS24_05375 [Pedosphaera sp.]|nr:hypothetical protein [Pedosphaera sp.]